MKLILPYTLCCCLLLTLSPGFASEDYSSEKSMWEALSTPGHVALVRHALAPGTGDPADFDVNDCSTQRNLSDDGRQQATHIGELFREHAMPEAQVFSSQWCRCIETAQRLSLSVPEELAILNSFFQSFDQRQPQTDALKEWLFDADLSQTTILVTHQVNITALTDVYPSSGEIVVVKVSSDDTLDVLGTIPTL